MTPPWMLLRLGLETLAHHAPADEDRLAAMSITTLDGYRRFLLRIWGFEMPVERAMLHVKEIDNGFVESACRAARLRDDLLALGYSDASLAVQPTLAHVNIKTGAHVLGWMFVLERHTLLSGIICRQLQHVLGSQIATSMQYLSSYGETPGSRIRRFGETANRYARNFPPTIIVASAQEGFRAQRQWYLGAPRSSDDLPSSATG